MPRAWQVRVRDAAMVVGLVLAPVASRLAAQPVSATKETTIAVNFDAEGEFTDSYGDKITVKKSKLTADQRKKVIAHIQANYDDAVGKGKVVVKEGADGDQKIVVSSGEDPKDRLGNAGAKDGSALVFEGEYVSEGFADDKLVNGVATTAAHEVGHRLGASHNWDKPPTKMTEGSKQTWDGLTGGAEKFTTDDVKSLSANLSLLTPAPSSNPTPPALYAFVGHEVPSRPHLEDWALDVYATFTGPGGAEFGYMSLLDQFVFLGVAGTPFVSFVYDGGYDMAVRVGSTLFTLLGGDGSVVLSNPNPNNPVVFGTALLTFDAGGATAQLLLQGPIEPATGGFLAAVPEPATVGLVALGLALLVVGRSRGRRAHPAHSSARSSRAIA